MRGGVGAGTEIRFQLKAGGRTLQYHGHVTEPEPGRVLRETDTESDLVSTFTVDSASGGRSERGIRKRSAAQAGPRSPSVS